MSSLSYNPNINIPSYHSQTNDYTMPVEQFNNMNIPMSNNMNSNNMNSNNMNSNNMNSMPMSNNIGNMHINPPYLSNNSYKKSKNTYEPFINENDNSKIDWYLIGKKIVIYTILFLIMSHLIMNNMICKFVPLVGDNEIACMVTKGIIMSIAIIILQMIL